MGKIGLPEILVILLLALVLFGGRKLAGVGKALGQSIREFKNELGDKDKKTDGNEDEASTDAKTEEKKDEQA